MNRYPELLSVLQPELYIAACPPTPCPRKLVWPALIELTILKRDDELTSTAVGECLGNVRIASSGVSKEHRQPIKWVVHDEILRARKVLERIERL